jgi:hypothetical protein
MKDKIKINKFIKKKTQKEKKNQLMLISETSNPRHEPETISIEGKP